MCEKILQYQKNTMHVLDWYLKCWKWNSKIYLVYILIDLGFLKTHQKQSLVTSVFAF